MEGSENHVANLAMLKLTKCLQSQRKELCEDEKGVLQLMVSVPLDSLRSSCRSFAPLAAWMGGWVERFSC